MAEAKQEHRFRKALQAVSRILADESIPPEEKLGRIMQVVPAAVHGTECPECGEPECEFDCPSGARPTE